MKKLAVSVFLFVVAVVLSGCVSMAPTQGVLIPLQGGGQGIAHLDQYGGVSYVTPVQSAYNALQNKREDHNFTRDIINLGIRKNESEARINNQKIDTFGRFLRTVTEVRNKNVSNGTNVVPTWNQAFPPPRPNTNRPTTVRQQSVNVRQPAQAQYSAPKQQVRQSAPARQTVTRQAPPVQRQAPGLLPAAPAKRGR